MKTSTPSWLLAALGALALTVGGSAGAADPSQWKCESCPFDDEGGIHGQVDAGAGYVSKRSAKFGDFTGLDRKGGFVVLGGDVRYRGDDGVYGGLAASELGLDSREIVAEHGREGRYALRLGYSELPRRFSDSARTPFLGVGGATLTLPEGFPAGTTADMPLAATLQPASLELERRRLDVGASLLGGAQWLFRANARRDVRDGTQRHAGSFFSTASQLPAPVDHTTDLLDVSASYAGRRLQATVGYHASLFRNGFDALTWQNPFTTGALGATQGQLALAPDNEFHQVSASFGYRVTPMLRASADVAVGRATQNADFLAATLNPALVVPALPATSLDGRVDTLDANVRLVADLTPALRLSASVSRNERDNETPVAVYPLVATDMFVGAETRANTPYSFTRDRAKLSADVRAPWTIKLAAGVEYDRIERPRQESDETRETTLWLRASARPLEMLSLSAKAAHAERENSGYSVLPAVQPPENPLLRKYNQADRRRDSGGVRADVTVGENVTVGLTLDAADDDYTRSLVGLTRARSGSAGADVAVAIGEDTRLHLFGHAERIRSRQQGSQQFGAPDWSGRVRDAVGLVGIGATHAALKGKLELRGDIVSTRSRSEVELEIDGARTPFPAARTSLDALKLAATYKLKDNVSLLGSLWHERYSATDWHWDGVLPATVPNLLAFGEQPPRYRVNVLRLAVRYAF